MAALNDWDVVDDNNNATPPDGWPEGTMQYSEVNNTGRAVQGTLKRYFADVNGSLVAGGVADAYTLSLNESGYTAYFTGMYFACQINSDNTGATTMDVNGLGAQNVVNRDGTPLEAGALQSGGIYEFRYDGTNFQLAGSIAGASVTVSDATFTNTSDPDLVDTDVAINVGAVDPDVAQHLELGPSDLQSKSDATTAAVLRLNRLGGNTEVGAQSGSGSVELYDAGQLALSTFQAGVSVSGDVTVSSPPVAADAPDSYIELYDLNETTRIGFMGMSLSSTFQIANEMRGAAIQLIGRDNGGTQRAILLGDPDVGTGLYYNGSQKIQTAIVGMNVQGQVATATPPTTEFVNTRVELYDSDGSDILGSLGYNGSNVLELRNFMHNGGVEINAEDSGGTERRMLFCDPGADVSLYYNGAQVATSLPAASGGLQANNTLTGGGFERVLTTSDIGSGTTQVVSPRTQLVNVSSPAENVWFTVATGQPTAVGAFIRMWVQATVAGPFVTGPVNDVATGYARETGSAEPTDWETVVCRGRAEEQDTGGNVTIQAEGFGSMLVPLDGSGQFDWKATSSNFTTSISQVVIVVDGYVF